MVVKINEIGGKSKNEGKHSKSDGKKTPGIIDKNLLTM